MMMPPDSSRRSVADGFNLLQDSNKSDRAVVEIERHILQGLLRPGDRLPTELELCEQFGVSRSVVRDAVRTLAARGLVTVRQGHGISVAAPNDEAFGRALVLLLARSELKMADVVDARAAIETQLVPLAAVNATDEDLEKLHATFMRFEAAVQNAEWIVARDTHLAFHVGLLQALHLPALELFLKPMTEIILVSSAPPRLTAEEDWEVRTHPPILDALKARDGEAARKAMYEHFSATRSPQRYRDFRDRPFGSVFAEIPWALP